MAKNAYHVMNCSSGRPFLRPVILTLAFIVMGIYASAQPTAKNCFEPALRQAYDSLKTPKNRAQFLVALAEEIASTQYDCSVEYYLEALHEFEKVGDTTNMVKASLGAAKAHLFLGNPTLSLELILHSIDLNYPRADPWSTYRTNALLSEFCHYSGDYDLAYKYSSENLPFVQSTGDPILLSKEHFRMANSLRMRGQYREALKEYRRAQEIRRNYDDFQQENSSYGMSEIGKVYLALDNPQKALSIFHEVLSRAQKRAAKIHVIADVHLNIADCHIALKQFDSTLFYTNKGFAMANELGNAPLKMELNRAMSEAYAALGVHDKAYERILRFNKLKTATQSKESTSLLLKTTLDLQLKSKNTQLAALAYETETARREAGRQKERMYLLVLLSVFIITTLSLLIFYILLRGSYQRLHLESKMLGLKMKPHFIGNLLTAVQDALYTQPLGKVEEYLINSAKHIRHVLERSYLDWIPLNKELEELHRYVALQKIRFGERIQFVVHVHEQIQAEKCEVPSFLLQPLIENAIEHGMGRTDHSVVEVLLSIKPNDHRSFSCSVKNTSERPKKKNGKAHDASTDKDSRSLEIIGERLRLYAKNNSKAPPLQLKSIESENQPGFMVSMLIPFRNT